MVDEAVFSSESDEWGTPIDLFRELDREFNFTLDPCADSVRILKRGMKKYTIKDNGMIRSWEGETVFVNPPYSEIGEWTKKCYGESRHATIVMLIPSRTDTKYFHDFVYNKAELRFIKGRLRFVDHGGLKKSCAPFPSMICVYRQRNDKEWW